MGQRRNFARLERKEARRRRRELGHETGRREREEEREGGGYIVERVERVTEEVGGVCTGNERKICE